MSLNIGLENLQVGPREFHHMSKVRLATKYGVFENVRLEANVSAAGDAGLFGSSYCSILTNLEQHIPQMIRMADEYCKKAVTLSKVTKVVNGKTITSPDYDLFDNASEGKFDNSKEFRIGFIYVSNTTQDDGLEFAGSKTSKINAIVQFFTQHDSGRGFDACFFGNKLMFVHTSP